MTALLLLGPWTPMLFQGQEYGSTRPFLYFADHHAELARLVRSGRADFLRQFPGFAAEDMRDRITDPAAAETFEQCKLDPRERRSHREHLALHRDLLELRRADPVLRGQGAAGLDGAVVGPEALLLRWFDEGGADRLLVVNLGVDLATGSLAEPLAAPPEGRAWRLAWSSEDPRYGGRGSPLPFHEEGVRLTGHAAMLLVPMESEARPRNRSPASAGAAATPATRSWTASGSSRTGSAGTRRAPSAACARAATTGCSSRRSRASDGR
jgi:maltooligosyltrehalose trehalohydrolase